MRGEFLEKETRPAFRFEQTWHRLPACVVPAQVGTLCHCFLHSAVIQFLHSAVIQDLLCVGFVTDIERSKLSVLGTRFVESHFVDDLF